MQKIILPLVLEGGGLRCVFTAGILEFLLDNNIEFQKIVGVSAGAAIAATYISRQKERNFRVNVGLASDTRFVGFRNFVRHGAFFNFNFIYDEIPNKIDPFDYQTYFNSSVDFHIGATSLKSGQVHFFKNDRPEKQYAMQVLMATSTIPMLSYPILIDGQFYYDGGVAESIPIEYSLQSHDKAVVILSRNRLYRKGRQKLQHFIKYKFRHHPQFRDVLLSRNQRYNQTLDTIHDLESRGRLFVLAPESFQVGRMERRSEKLQPLYEHGYQVMSERFDDLKKFIKH